MGKTVLFLGASRYYVRSIEAIQRAGYRVVAVDRDPMAPGLGVADIGLPCDIKDVEGLTRIVGEQSADGILPMNDYGVLAASRVAARTGLFGLPEDVVVGVIDKGVMRERARKAGIPCPRYHIASTRDEFRAAAADIGYPVILKPTNGIAGGSRGVIVVEEESRLDSAIAHAQSFFEEKTTLVEDFVEVEVEHSAEVLVHDGTPHVVGISDKVKTPVPYRVDKHITYPTRIEGGRLDGLIRQIEDIARATGVATGPIHVELGTTADGFVLWEVAARCGGGPTPDPILPYVYGVDEVVEAARLLCGDPPGNLVARPTAYADWNSLTPAPGTVKAVHGIEAARGLDGILDVAVLRGPGDVIERVTYGTQRSGYVVSTGETREAALALGREAERMIVFEYENGG